MTSVSAFPRFEDWISLSCQESRKSKGTAGVSHNQSCRQWGTPDPVRTLSSRWDSLPWSPVRLFPTFLINHHKNHESSYNKFYTEMTRNILSNLAIVCIRKADSRKREGRQWVILNIPPPPANISGPSLYCTPVSSQAKREEDQGILSVNQWSPLSLVEECRGCALSFLPVSSVTYLSDVQTCNDQDIFAQIFVVVFLSLLIFWNPTVIESLIYLPDDGSRFQWSNHTQSSLITI